MTLPARPPVFCDWLSMRFPGEIKGPGFDKWLSCESFDGGVHWQRPAWVDLRDPRQRTDTRKSDSTNIRVRWDPAKSVIHVSGNLGRWCRRDNVWGDGVHRAAWRFLDFLLDQHRMDMHGDPTLTRVDLTANLRFASAQDAYDYKAWCEGRKLGYINPRAYLTGVTWVTENWSAKLYDKIEDLKRHGHNELAERLLLEIGYLMRLETTLRTDELTKHGLNTLSAWMEKGDDMAAKIFEGKFAPLTRGGSTADELLRELPLRLANALDAWRNGRNFTAAVHDGQLSRRSYYRLRAELLPYGVDISQPCNVTRLHIKPREIEWAYVAAPAWYREAA